MKKRIIDLDELIDWVNYSSESDFTDEWAGNMDRGKWCFSYDAIVKMLNHYYEDKDRWKKEMCSKWREDKVCNFECHGKALHEIECPYYVAEYGRDLDEDYCK